LAVQPIPVPIQRFFHVHVDLVGPLPVSEDGYAYLLTAIDRSTRWAEAIPLKATSAADCAEAFIGGWVSRFGVLVTLTSDRGVQFTSSFWAAVTGCLGVQHKTTTAAQPGCCWASAQHNVRSLECQPPSWYTAHSCRCQVSYCQQCCQGAKILAAELKRGPTKICAAEKTGGRIFFKYAKKGPNYFEYDYSHKKP
jgi:Integrase core domain